MLALATGWTPDVLADLPGRFRRACHWALYVTRMAPDGLQDIDLAGLTPEQKVEAAKAKLEMQAIRELLFPEGD